MQEFIEVLKIHRDTAYEKEKRYPNNKEYYEGRAKAFEDAISFAEAHLEKEKEVITSAYNEGKYYKSNDIDRMWEDAEEWYNETFNTKEK